MTKLLSVLGRRWAILLIGVIVGLVAGALSPNVAASGDRTRWEAKRVITANPGTPAITTAPQDALKATRGAVPERAAEILGYDGDPQTLAKSVTSTYSSETNSILLSAEADRRADSTKRVEAFADAFLELQNAEVQAADLQRVERLRASLLEDQTALADLEKQFPELTTPDFVAPAGNPFWSDILRRRGDIQTRIADTQGQIDELDESLVVNAPYEVLGAEPPSAVATGLITVPGSRAARALLLGLFGLLLSGVLVMVLERSVPRIDTRDELADITRLPILAEIGYLSKRRRMVEPGGSISLEGAWGEPYRRVRSAVQFVQANARLDVDWTPSETAPSRTLSGRPSTFLVTSTSPAEGKSTTTALLSVALAENGTPTVVIGGDFRRPAVDRLVGGATSPTMRELAVFDLDRPTVDDVVQGTTTENLYLASPGPATREVTPLIAAVKEVTTESVRRQCTVVIDSSPLMAANDTVDLLPVVDYVLLVVRAGKTTVKDFVDTVATLERMDSQILGTLLIGTRFDGRHSTYYYDYYSPNPD